MPSKDPRQMKTGEVAKMARKAGIQDTGNMNKEQMIQAIQKSSTGASRSAQGASAGSRAAPKGDRM